MASPADETIDRRRLRRKLTFWRVVALGVIAAALVAGALWASGGPATSAVEHIAKIRIEGTITEDEELLERLAAVRKADNVRGVVLSIDSPGGTTAGGEAIYDEVRLLAEAKPVVAQVGTLAASAGYLIASASDHIVARKTSIVGSIGVLIQYPDVTGLMDKIGVKLEEVKSSPLKAEPSPFNPTTEEERAAIRSMIMDSYDWFVGIVDERRPLTREQTQAVADGKVFTGRQALDLKLVDGLGGEREAVAWLETRDVPKGLEVVEWKKKRDSGLAAFVTGSWAPFGDQAAFRREIVETLKADRMFLDGLVSLWQPE